MIRVLVVEDSIELQEAIKLTLSDYKNIYATFAETLRSAHEHIESNLYDMIISDKKLPDGDGLELVALSRQQNPDICFILMTAYPEVEHIKDAIEEGVFYYLTKPFKKYELDIVLRLAMQNINLKKQVQYYKEKETSNCENYLLEGGEVFNRLLDDIRKIARTNSNCLICGESGVGKEVVANLIHRFSNNKDSPFIVVNCPAISPNLFESELFGHEKGAFTGATVRKIGKFELADGGSILLDEITEIPVELQSKLLRVIQEKVIERVGSVRPVYINVRIIATTNRDIKSLVAQGKFRDDLYHRLNVVRIDVAPLRERREDIERLVYFFNSRFSKRCASREKRFTAEAVNYLKQYSWPGNIRELANFIERIYVLESGSVIDDNIVKKYLIRERHSYDDDLKVTSVSQSSPHLMALPDLNSFPLPTININLLEKIAIETALKKHNFNKSRAARELGITERTLRNKLKKMSPQVLESGIKNAQ
ncbi:MAG: sigma-54-dependent transcriptional regulator [Planctomycetota bacterium]